MTERIVKALIIVALIAGLVASIVWGYEHWRNTIATTNYKLGDAAGSGRVQKLWDEDRAQAQELALENARLSAKETTRRIEAQQENQRAQDELLARTRADRDRLGRTVDSLRLRAATYLDAAGCGALTGDPALECVRKAAAAIGDALGQCGQVARNVAADADDNRARGLKCEADYDALTLKLTTP